MRRLRLRLLCCVQVAQRVLELLKVFNSRTCQLVLGAGAMQVGTASARMGSRWQGMHHGSLCHA